ncbi:alpha/beta hydrolase [Dactylosporangium sp. NPDC051485]|uniref:alpha/beta fold hydrolase n=1 Tax=Dactylosporangium sp. NPDC051485 TaxID=3154846 RepID=UPI0034366FAF
MESRSIQRDGVQLHGLWRPGQGSPVLVVPGVMADAESFVPVVEAITRPEPVLILDRRGRSSSGPLGEGYSMETEVADTAAWIGHLGAPVTLVGWSYGATIALETAARDERIEGIVGYEPVLGPFGRDALPALREADPDRRVEIINLDVSRLPKERVETLRTTPAWPVLRRLSEPLAEELTALNAFRPHESWAEVAAELILGEHNRGVEPYGPAFERVVGHLPRSRTTMLPGQGHLAHTEAPAELGRLIGELIG